MKLDRNDNPSGIGKYAVVNMRRLRALGDDLEALALKRLGELETLGVIDRGAKGDEDEFFVIKLKDRNAAAALYAYAASAALTDAEYAREIGDLADRAKNHPSLKTPD